MCLFNPALRSLLFQAAVSRGLRVLVQCIAVNIRVLPHSKKLL